MSRIDESLKLYGAAMAFDLQALRCEIVELFEESAPAVFDRRDLYKERARFTIIRRKGEPTFSGTCIECHAPYVTRWKLAKTCGYDCSKRRHARLAALSVYAYRKLRPRGVATCKLRYERQIAAAAHSPNRTERSFHNETRARAIKVAEAVRTRMHAVDPLDVEVS